MTYFPEAYNKTMGHEGGYVNDPDDAGKETYKGISRKFNPEWEGWSIIDFMKKGDDFPECLSTEPNLDIAVKRLYKMKYFDPYDGDSMPKGLAMEMFDTSVNMGVERTVGFIQTSLNVLNRNGLLYEDMVVDGQYGPTTERCLSAYLKADDEDILVKVINILQGNHYIEYMKKSQKQEKYARGWLKRVDISK